MQRPSGLTTVLCSLAFAGATGTAAMPTSSRAGTYDVPQRAARADTTRPSFTTTDVRFMQGMIAHHAQALVMAALVPSHTDRDAMHLLAQRIEISQRDEIALDASSSSDAARVRAMAGVIREIASAQR